MVNHNAMNQLSKYPHLKWYVSNLKSIPGGKYRWGAFDGNDGIQITMSSFRMGDTPVTWGMWSEYTISIRDPGWGFPADHPVVNVSWNDIMNTGGYCEWASDVAGFKLTLPTDAQWEYAARGGQDGLDYPWGNNSGRYRMVFDKSKLWWSERFPGSVHETAAVNRTNRIYRNGYGLTDMVGNVWQWCADYHHKDYRPDVPPGKDPVDTRKSANRCLRGGSWYDNIPSKFLCANRNSFAPGSRGSSIGFRLSAAPK